MACTFSLCSFIVLPLSLGCLLGNSSDSTISSLFPLVTVISMCEFPTPPSPIRRNRRVRLGGQKGAHSGFAAATQLASPHPLVSGQRGRQGKEVAFHFLIVVFERSVEALLPVRTEHLWKLLLWWLLFCS